MTEHCEGSGCLDEIILETEPGDPSALRDITDPIYHPCWWRSGSMNEDITGIHMLGTSFNHVGEMAGDVSICFTWTTTLVDLAQETTLPADDLTVWNQDCDLKPLAKRDLIGVLEQICKGLADAQEMRRQDCKFTEGQLRTLTDSQLNQSGM